MMRVLSPLFAVALVAAFFAAAPLDADHEFAREAVERGEILPLTAILERVEQDFRGEMLEVELEREDEGPFAGRPIYEVKILTPGGDVTELYYDARDGTLLRARGHDLERSGRDEDDEYDEDDEDEYESEDD